MPDKKGDSGSEPKERQVIDIKRETALISRDFGFNDEALLLFVRIGVVALLVGSLAASALAAPRASLRVMRERPLVLRGADFEAREAVRIVVRNAGKTLTRSTRAGVRGGFTVEFRARVDFCSGLRITAQGEESGIVRANLARRVCASP